jgi:hypothetical protein
MQSASDHRSDCPASRSRGLDQLCSALTDGLTEGLREHLPGAVGIIVKTIAICLSAICAHVVLDVSMTSTTIGAGTATLTSTVISALRLLGYAAPANQCSTASVLTDGICGGLARVTHGETPAKDQ